jgi:hypothetical protein
MNQRDRSNETRLWVPFLGVPLERVRPHFWTFSVCFVITLIFYVYVHVVDADNPTWRYTPSLIIGDTTRAAAFWVLASPILVEGVVMVFGWLYVEKKRQEARREANALWREWNRRRMEAEANGEPFTESPPDVEAEHNRNSG